jgi:hypothetical protein
MSASLASGDRPGRAWQRRRRWPSVARRDEARGERDPELPGAPPRRGPGVLLVGHEGPRRRGPRDLRRHAGLYRRVSGEVLHGRSSRCRQRHSGAMIVHQGRSARSPVTDRTPRSTRTTRSGASMGMHSCWVAITQAMSRGGHRASSRCRPRAGRQRQRDVDPVDRPVPARSVRGRPPERWSSRLGRGCVIGKTRPSGPERQRRGTWPHEGAVSPALAGQGDDLSNGRARASRRA